VDYIAEKLTAKNASIPSRLMAKVLTEIGPRRFGLSN
jgi:hypothetical protein